MGAWAKANWKKAGDIGWERQQEKAREGMRLKAEKKKLQEEKAMRKRGKVAPAPAT